MFILVVENKVFLSLAQGLKLKFRHKKLEFWAQPKVRMLWS